MNIFRLFKKRKYISMVVVVLCMMAFVFFRYAATASASQEDIPFETAIVSRGDVMVTISSTGSLAAEGTVDVGTQVSGTISTVSVDYNDTVKKGQTLATLNQALFNAEVSVAKAEVASAKAKLDQAQAEYNRNETLHTKGYISDVEFLVFKTNLSTAKADLVSKKASLSHAQTNLEYTVIRSPIDGTVIERSIEEGQTVAASLSTPTLFIIAKDLSQMQIEVDVDESDIGQIKVGQTAEFEVAAYPDEKYTGLVEQIRLEPQTISNVVTYTVVVKSENQSGTLLPGMTATVDFIVNQQLNALLIPDSAFSVSLGDDKSSMNAGDRSWIYVLENDQPPKRIQVEKGLSDGSNTSVSGQNIEGKRIITSVKPGAEDSRQGLFARLMPGPPKGGGAGGPR